MAEEKKYTRAEVLSVIDTYCQVERKYAQRGTLRGKPHELRTFIANAKHDVPPELQTADFKKHIGDLEEALRILT